PAPPGECRAGAGRRAPSHSVRLARGGPLPGGAGRPGAAVRGAARPHRLRSDRARSGHRAARGRAGDRAAQRPAPQGGHAGGDRAGRGGPGHLHGRRPRVALRGGVAALNWFKRADAAGSAGPVLEIERLEVYYGRAHALQEVSLRLDRGTLAVVGRNGMGKTTLCNAITGLLPDGATATGRIRLGGADILGVAPNEITARGVAYVPQGRRVWPSLSVDEHLRLAARSGLRGAWTVERVYQSFPRLAERRGNGGAQLSGGEQQMLAISRALLLNPRLLVMDEPTEGLAPVIVQQVEAMLSTLAAEGELAILLIEQNLGVAMTVADTVDVMVNGRIA